MEKIIDVMRNIMDEYNTVSKKRGELRMLLKNDNWNNKYRNTINIEHKHNKMYIDRLSGIEFCIEEMMCLVTEKYAVHKEYRKIENKEVNYYGEKFIGTVEYDEYVIFDENGEEI